MNRTAFVRCTSIAAAMLLLAAGAGAATPGLLPAQPGDSILYRYDVDGAHPSLGQVWVVRSNATHLSVTVSPAEEAPGSFSFDVFANGGVRAAGNESPVEPSAVAMEMARNFASAVNLVAPVATGARLESWSLEVPAPGESGVMKLNARIASASGNERTAVADGAATVTLPPGPPDKRGRKPAPLLADVGAHRGRDPPERCHARGVIQLITRERRRRRSTPDPLLNG